MASIGYKSATGRLHESECGDRPFADRSSTPRCWPKAWSRSSRSTRHARSRSLDERRSTWIQPSEGFCSSTAKDLYYATFDGSTAVRLTNHPGRKQWPQFSPDGKSVAFVRDFDLFVVDIATQTERRLTTGGRDDLRHGQADWVYYEEIFNRRWPAFWWSPDSKQIAFMEFDDAGVPFTPCWMIRPVRDGTRKPTTPVRRAKSEGPPRCRRQRGRAGAVGRSLRLFRRLVSDQ